MSKPTGRPPGRPQHKPTGFDRGQVSVWAEGGVPQAAIARKLHIAIDTLRKHYTEDLTLGSECASADVIGHLYAIATGKVAGTTVRDQLLAGFFWLKCRKGWKDHSTMVVQNPDGSGLFDDWPADKLAAVSRRAVEVLEREAKAKKKASG